MIVNRLSKTKRNLFLLLFVSLFAGCAGLKDKDEEQYIFYPYEPAAPRIQYLTSFSGPKDLDENENLFSKFIVGEDNEQSALLKKPYGLAIHDGVIYAADLRSPGYVQFDLKSRKFDVIYGSFGGKMKKPINIVLDKDGTKYITDTSRNLILVYDTKNKFIKVIGDGEQFKPSDIVIVDNKLFVTDIKNHMIRVIDKNTDKELYTIGGKTDNNNVSMYYPTNIALGPNNHLYVSETGNFRVQELTLDGKFVQTFGKVGTGLGQFARPKGVDVDREGRIYVVDAAFQNVQILNDKGQLLLFFGEAGNERYNINLPTGVVIDYDHVSYFQKYAAPGFKIEYIVLVASQFGRSKINVFGFGKMTGMEYPDAK